ncbi:porin family protein [Oleiagrimonas soli]|uniref:Opacity protein-like surface antigen n=1 Tax=Oleiagrimonas soli TaxID=1543381 RepID=A0A099CWX9_9GAMM|nr:porin family protein [Oleiagrimonas soli]KGI78483.1 hypothetical protein LF63_0103095 [Oleiagrimonas soli]MBB6184267.1 opacity protein-like surface antigen [Oleiagrimonas soli]
MNRKIIVIALLCTGSCSATAAQAENPSGWFVNTGVGTAHYDAKINGYKMGGNDSHSSFQVNAGWRWEAIGVEAGYVSLGSITQSLQSSDFASYPYSTPYRSDKTKLSGDGWTLGLNGHFNPTEKWYVSAHGGLFMWKGHESMTLVPITGTTEHYSYDTRSTDWYAGVGTGVDFTRHISLGVNFDYYKMKKGRLDIGNRVYSVNLEYRF